MTHSNPLQKFYRQPALYISLPTQGKWYNTKQVSLNASKELAVYSMTARDDVLLNTPDAMLNGESLKNVIMNCVPDVHDVSALTLPDLESIFVAMKVATNNGVWDISKTCPKCNTVCTYEMHCQQILDQQSYIDESDCSVTLDNGLVVNVRPYNYAQRSLFMQRQFEEERAMKQYNAANPETNDFTKAGVMAQAVDRISSITFRLVAESIVSVELPGEEPVTKSEYIDDWLQNISSVQANLVIEAVEKLNLCGPKKTLDVVCTECSHEWTDPVSYDPISFFAKRS